MRFRTAPAHLVCFSTIFHTFLTSGFMYAVICLSVPSPAALHKFYTFLLDTFPSVVLAVLAIDMWNSRCVLRMENRAPSSADPKWLPGFLHFIRTDRCIDDAFRVHTSLISFMSLVSCFFGLAGELLRDFPTSSKNGVPLKVIVLAVGYLVAQAMVTTRLGVLYGELELDLEERCKTFVCELIVARHETFVERFEIIYRQRSGTIKPPELASQ